MNNSRSNTRSDPSFLLRSFEFLGGKSFLEICHALARREMTHSGEIYIWKPRISTSWGTKCLLSTPNLKCTPEPAGRIAKCRKSVKNEISLKLTTDRVLSTLGFHFWICERILWDMNGESPLAWLDSESQPPTQLNIPESSGRPGGAQLRYRPAIMTPSTFEIETSPPMRPTGLEPSGQTISNLELESELKWARQSEWMST